jgi:hypothetical protein
MECKLNEHYEHVTKKYVFARYFGYVSFTKHQMKRFQYN